MTDSHDDEREVELTLAELQAEVALLSWHDTSDDAVDLRTELGIVELDDGSPARAVTQFEFVAAVLTDRLGPSDPDTMVARGHLGRALTEARLFERAEGCLRELLDDRTEVLGPEHPQTLVTRGNLLRAIGFGGRPEEALSMAEDLLADRERLLGPDHPETLQTRGHIARLLDTAGEVEEAVAMHEALLADRERVLGPDHDDTWTSRHNVTLTRFQSGAGTAADLTEYLVAVSERYGFDHPAAMVVRADVTGALLREGRFEEAAIAVRQLISDRYRVLGELDPATTWAQMLLGKLMMSAGRFDEAVRQFDAVVRLLRATLGPTAIDALGARRTLVWALGIHDPDGRLEAETESLSEDALQTLEPNHPMWDSIEHSF